MTLELYRHRFEGVADEMGVTLRRTSYSPNIKERLDFSCAVFDGAGQMAAQAAHIPVHLGAMPASMDAARDAVDTWQPGDVVILNDPYAGGTHLPDITMISPVMDNGATDPVFFVASRAHHADVGGMTPGSLPLSTEIYQEGLIIPPIKLYRGGTLNEDVQRLLLRNVRTPDERRGDLAAQRAAHTVGTRRLHALLDAHGRDAVTAYVAHLQQYSARLVRHMLADAPDGTYSFEDVLELERGEATLRVAATIDGDTVRFDFAGTDDAVEGSLNAVLSITQSACYYVIRCLVDAAVPMNAGCFAPVDVSAPAGCLVNARDVAAHRRYRARRAGTGHARARPGRLAGHDEQPHHRRCARRRHGVRLLRNDRRGHGRQCRSRRPQRRARAHDEHAQHTRRSARTRVSVSNPRIRAPHRQRGRGGPPRWRRRGARVRAARPGHRDDAQHPAPARALEPGRRRRRGPWPQRAPPR